MADPQRPAPQRAPRTASSEDRAAEIQALTDLVMGVRLPNAVGDAPELPSCQLVDLDHDIPAGSTGLTIPHKLGRRPVGAIYLGQLRMGGPLRPVEIHPNLQTSDASVLKVVIYSAAGHGASRTKTRYLVF